MDLKLKKLHAHKVHLSTATWWLVSLLCAFLLALALGVHAIFLFTRALVADAVTQGTGTAVESLSRQELKETLDDFDARAAQFESFKASYTGVADPSI